MKNKLQKLIVVIILANFLVLNFAHAQQPPTPPSGAALTKEALDNARTLEGCRELRNLVNTVSHGEAKAIWDTTHANTFDGTEFTDACHIVPAFWEDRPAAAGGPNILGDSFGIPAAYYEFQTKIRNSIGITEQQWADAHAKYQREMLEASGLSKIIGWVLNAILSVFTSFVLWLAGVVGSIFVEALDWILESTRPEIIHVGWTIVRDICNTFFILILIAIGLGTILRLKEYSEYGHLLGELILMAILVNFSYIIATTLIDFVNVFISMFAISGHKELWAVLYKHINYGDLDSLPNGWMSGLVQGLSKFIFAFVALATFLALTLMLVVRIVVLYILIILSPLAYTLDILPATKHYAHEWWGYFLKNLIWVPVALLIMKIGMELAKAPEFTASDSAFNIILIMAFFWGAVVAAEHMGAAGGKAIAGFAEKVGHKVGHTAGEYVFRGEPIAHAGTLVRKATGWGGLENFGHRVTGATAKIEAIPGAIKKGLENSEKNRQSEVQKIQRAILRSTVGLGTDADSIKEMDDVDLEALVADPKVNRSRIESIMANGKKQALKGVLRAVMSGTITDRTLLDEIDQGLWKRMGGSGMAPVLTYRASGSDVEVSWGGPGSPKFFNVGSHNEAFEKSLMTDEQRDQLAKDERKLRERQTIAEASMNNPAVASQISRAEVEGRIISPGEAVKISQVSDAVKGIGSRIPIERSVVSPSGQRVIISENVAAKIDLSSDADLNTEDDVRSLVTHLEGEGVSKQETARIINAYKTIGSVAIQKGSFASLKSVVSSRRVEQKQHERSHGFYNYVRNTNSGDFQRVIKVITSDKGFSGVVTKLRANDAYKSYSDDQIAEEVLTNVITREQMSESTRNEVESILKKYRSQFIEKTKQIAKEARTPEKLESLRDEFMNDKNSFTL